MMANWRNKLLASAAPALVCAPLISIQSAEAATLSKWTFNNNNSRLEFTTDTSVQPKAFLLVNPYRIVIDLPNTKLGSSTARRNYSGDVKQVRIGQFNTTTTRIVVELAANHVIDPKQTFVKRTSGNNWMLDLDGTVGLPTKGSNSVALTVPVNGNVATKPPTTTTPTPPLPKPPITTRPPVTGPSARNFCRAQVPSTLNRILNKNRSARWGALVQTQSGSTIFDRGSNTLLAPASNNKIFTTAAALSKFGPNYRIKTSVLGDSSGSTVNSLRIIGQGDPTFSTTDLRSLTQQLKNKGVRTVGTLIGDDTLFKGPSINPNWEAEDRGQAYAPPVNSLIVNENIVGLTLAPRLRGQSLAVKWDDPTDQKFWRVDNRSVTASRSGGEFLDLVPSGNRIVITGALREGSASEPVGVAIPNEGNYLVRKFTDLLNTSQVKVNRSTLVKRTPAPKGLVELASVQSDPLSSMITTTNLNSNNLYAESLLKVLGAKRLAAAADTRISGIAELKAVLGKLGVDTNQVRIVDGSGLAPNNRTSAKALVQTLNAMASGGNAELFKSTLPVAGRSGTLSNRFRGTAAQGNVFAKTGTISNVVSLAGYIDPANHPRISFAVLANSGGSASAIRAIVDEMVVKLMDLDDC